MTRNICDGCAHATRVDKPPGFIVWFCSLHKYYFPYPGLGCKEKEEGK